MTSSIVEWARLAGRPAGYSDAAELIRAYDAHDSLPAVPLAKLMDALRVFAQAGSADEQLQSFGIKFQLRGKQGRREPTAAEAERRILIVADVFLRERRFHGEGMTPSAARATATREVATEWHVGITTVQGHIREFSDEARQHVMLIDHAERLRNRKRADKS